MKATEVADNLNAFLALPAAIRSFCQQLSDMPAGDIAILAVIVLVAAAILTPTVLALLKKSIERLEWFGSNRRIQQLTNRIKEGWLTPAQVAAYNAERFRIETQAAIGSIAGVEGQPEADLVHLLIARSGGRLTMSDIKKASPYLIFDGHHQKLLKNGKRRLGIKISSHAAGALQLGLFVAALLLLVGAWRLMGIDGEGVNWLVAVFLGTALTVPLFFMPLVNYIIGDILAIKRIEPILEALQSDNG